MENKRSTYLPFLFAIILITGIVIGTLINKETGPERLLIYPNKDKIITLLNYIEQRYVDTISKHELTEEIIPQIIENLDPHSVYIPAKQLEKVNEPLVGNFSGIGVQFRMVNDSVVILKTIEHGPSEAAGVLAGDRIIKVFEEDVSGVQMPTDSIVSRLRGSKGSSVMVTVYRKSINENIEFKIIRDDIPLYSMDVSYMINDSLGFIKLSKFSSTTYDEFLAGVDHLKKQGMTNLILDLRGNGGGYLKEAIGIADQFLEESNLIVYTEGRASPRKNYYATSEGVCQNIKVAILIDEYSASASEILAGAIQDNDRGIIIGRRSFGKGLVGEQTRFNDGSALRLTVARYYTPTGRSIQKPYENGHEDYFKDIHNRFEHGEFYSADSINFADSLKFTTPNGKIVYGGGGIMPDFFVPADTLNVTPYFVDIRHRGLIFRFAFDYSDNHRELLLSKSENVESLEKFLDKQNILNQFIEYAQKHGVKPNREEIKISKEILEINLKAEIVKNFFDDTGYYPIIQTIDKTLQTAIQQISK